MGVIMKKIGKYSIKQLVFLFAFLTLFTFGELKVQAEGERAAFGSESYEWNLGEESKIGIYAEAEQNISSSELFVKYDTEVLEYVSGGELIEAGIIKVSGSSINTNEYMQMLQFTPISAGQTTITISEGTIINADGETVFVDPVSVNAQIVGAEGSLLEGISVNGVAVEGFQPETYEYFAAVTGDVENAEITVLPASRRTEISDSILKVGENMITIFSYNENGERTKYALKINRPEMEVVEESELQTEPTVIAEKEEQKIDSRTLFIIIESVLFFILIILIVILAKKIKKNRRRKERRRQKQLEKEKAEKVLEKLPVTDSVNVEELLEDKEVEISVRNVTMEFKHEKDESTSIKEMVIRTIKGQRSYEMFRALDDISFDIYKGEVVGIIGTNGSGKSTILKIISGALKPTSGRVEVDKRKIQLLTLGTGFDYELTGRENVYLNGAIIGYTKEYIDEKYDDIVKFAELEGFMEEKVRNYSSGMVSRLGFAIATVRDTPEILILDEVLSVGDMFFRKKSEDRIKEMMHGGSTVLIVSHSPDVIRKNCNKAIWIEKSKLRAIGDPKEVCEMYEKMNENPS